MAKDESTVPVKAGSSQLPQRRSITGRFGDPLFAFHRDMDNLFNEFRRSFWPLESYEPWSTTAMEFSPKLDIDDDDKEMTVTAEIPGLDKKDLDLSITQDSLTIRGEKKREHEEKKEGRYLCERYYGTFSRSIPLPEGIDLDKVDASFKNGVLTVKLAKTAESVKARKQIAVKG
jgi:HSP20 family protein